MKKLSDEELRMSNFNDLLNARFNRDADFDNVEFISRDAEIRAGVIHQRKPHALKRVAIILVAPFAMTIAGLAAGLSISLGVLGDFIKE